MKILLVLGHNRLTGVNTWAQTLAKQFNINGHEAHIEISSTDNNDFSFDIEFTGFYNLLKQSNITYYENTAIDYDSYDVVILSYGVHAHKLANYHGKKIYVLHGMPNRFSEIYKPPEGFYKIAVSQFLAEWHDCHTFVNHGVDMDIFLPADLPANKIPQNVLFITRHVKNDMMVRAVYELGIQADITMSENQETIIHKIQQSDFVIAYGRSCYEAMACGKPVFVGGNNGVDGWMKPYTHGIFLYKNCSGYVNHVGEESFDKIVCQLKRYRPYDGKVNRILAKTNHSAESMYLGYLSAIKSYGHD
jgi:hypothetical protein